MFRRILIALIWIVIACDPPLCTAQPGTTEPAIRASRANRQQPARRARQQAEPATREPMEMVTGYQLSKNPDQYHNQPTIARTADGTVWTAWVANRDSTVDEVIVASSLIGRRDSIVTGPLTISGSGTQFIRPVLAAVGNELICLWTESSETDRARIWYAATIDGKWNQARRLLPNEPRAHQNPEIAVSQDGKVAVAYQLHSDHRYHINLAFRGDNDQWSPARVPTEQKSNDWDPVIAWDTEGRLHLAWSGYFEGDYDIYWSRMTGEQLNTPKRMSARGEYDMHPWLAAGQDGAVWLCWDVVKIPAHGSSGKSTITGANFVGKETPSDETSGGRFGLWSGIEVRLIDGDSIRVPGSPREQITAPGGFVLAHRALAKIAISNRGEPWVIYRALQTQPAVWSANNRDGYLWEVVARPFRNGAWGDPLLFHQSDGYLEEPSVIVAPDGLKVAYTSEHRHSTARSVAYHVKQDDDPSASSSESDDKQSTDPQSEFYNHHYDFQGLMGWHGDIYIATLRSTTGLRPQDVASMQIEPAPQDKPVQEKLTRDIGRHEVTSGGNTYKLLWGDTHKHSNVSRCSLGTEPSPEDLYRYGMDVNLYDYLAMSDHSEYTTDYYWFRQQKIGDLYHIPHSMSVLYNSEWSMRFPYGHTNTIFPDRRKVKMHGWLGSARTLESGWELLEKGNYRAVTIPHTPADPGMGTTWPAYDPKYLRLVEIFQSGRGSYEFDGCLRQHNNATNKAGFYWKALEKGMHVGVIASSDHSYGAAYACVYAPENTREAVWQALHDRRTYGSTAYGTVLEMRSGDRWMGEAWSSRKAPVLQIYVRGSVPLRSVEIVGRFQTLFAAGSQDQPLNQAEFRTTWTDPEWTNQTSEQWYYVRVVQSDDEMAWSSPVWVTPTK